MEAWVIALAAGNAPPEIAGQWSQLLHAPDKQSLAYKALVAAADRARMSPVHLLARAKAIPSTHALHYDRFLGRHFPGQCLSGRSGRPAQPDLPVADVAAFSIDDDSTTEIDDAFSLECDWVMAATVSVSTLRRRLPLLP